MAFLLFYFFETRSHYIAQAGLKLEILQPQPPKYCDYGHVSPGPAPRSILIAWTEVA
jgi:hypothetical protein